MINPLNIPVESCRQARTHRCTHAPVPAAGKRPIRQPGRPASPPPEPRKFRLLVVDDERPMCELLALYFESKGLQVTTAPTVVEGTLRIEQEQFDVVILDWKLEGGLNGLDLLQLSRRLHPETPVIIFTGADDPRSIERQLAGTAAAVLPKMGPLNALSAEVARHLAKPG